MKASFKRIREAATADPVEQVAQDMEVRGALHTFLPRCGFAEKHTYHTVDEAKAAFAKRAGHENFQGAKQPVHALKESLINDLHQLIVVWHFGTTSIPPIKELPKSFTVAVKRHAGTAYKLAKDFVNQSKAKEVTAEMRVFVKDKSR